ncbi:hypothetical protein HK405_001599, partial [Cladochytrium tenue]
TGGVGGAGILGSMSAAMAQRIRIRPAFTRRSASSLPTPISPTTSVRFSVEAAAAAASFLTFSPTATTPATFPSLSTSPTGPSYRLSRAALPAPTRRRDRVLGVDDFDEVDDDDFLTYSGDSPLRRRGRGSAASARPHGQGVGQGCRANRLSATTSLDDVNDALGYAGDLENGDTEPDEDYEDDSAAPPALFERPSRRRRAAAASQRDSLNHQHGPLPLHSLEPAARRSSSLSAVRRRRRRADWLLIGSSAGGGGPVTPPPSAHVDGANSDASALAPFASFFLDVHPSLLIPSAAGIPPAVFAAS